MRIIERLLSEHRTIGTQAAAFETLLGRTTPDHKAIADVRWTMTKAMMQHTAFEERCLCLPLERDPRPAVAALAAGFKQDRNVIQDEFEAHMARWPSGAASANWDAYRHAALGRMHRLTDRMRREEIELFPLASGNAEIEAEAPNSMAERNWARSAWAVQESLRL